MWWQLLLLQIGFFLLLIFALQKLFHGHLLAGIKRIEKLQTQNSKKEEELNRMQEVVKKHSEKKLLDLDAELAARRKTLEEEIKGMKQAAFSMVEEEKNTLIAEMHEKERILGERLEREAGARAAELALQIVMNAFSKKMLETVHIQLTEELLDSLMELEEKKVRLGGKPVRVRSAFALSMSQKETLKMRIFQFLEPRERAKNASAIELVEEVSEALVAGFVVYLGEQVFDGSLRNKFDKYAKSQA